ncbi:hypothetical protein QFZ22_003774 [Streptomyces canus]|uniref:Phage tail protein n=1 Tax=Streptomyces canus TaxID=58343 RepID=A0AAW8FCI6_9ACTN|nr:hypothetical protein [Streptomyces canus]MDQ0907789.1 hypothetical protein [Streptomyces canus]
MAATVSNLVQGPATLYIGSFGATEPANAAVNSTPQTSAWTDLGGTTDGVELSIQQEYKELEVDQVVDIPGRRLVKRDMSVKTNLAEATLTNLNYALNDGTVAASGTGYSGAYTPAFTDSATQPTYRALIVHGWAPGNGSNNQSKRRMVILRKVLSSDNVEFAYKKEDQTVFSVTWSVHYVDGSTAPFKIVDEA